MGCGGNTIGGWRPNLQRSSSNEVGQICIYHITVVRVCESVLEPVRDPPGRWMLLLQYRNQRSFRQHANESVFSSRNIAKHSLTDRS